MTPEIWVQTVDGDGSGLGTSGRPRDLMLTKWAGDGQAQVVWVTLVGGWSC